MGWQRHTLATETGASLNYYHSVANGPLKGVLQVNHGMAEHAARYERFADALARAGYSTYAHDHRGHGHTTAPDSYLGSFAKEDGWQKVVADVHAMNEHAHSENPGVPLICFGHSMGSMIALSYAMQHPNSVNALAPWNTGVDTGIRGLIFKTILKIQRMFKGSDVPSPLIRGLTFDAWNKVFKPNRTEFDWLSRDEAEVDKYVADPFCGFDVSIGLWLNVAEGIYFGADDGNLKELPKDLPVHLQAGDQDPCTEKGLAMANIQRRMEARSMSDVTFELLENTRHESLNELNRDETTAKFVAWLDERFG